jgi:peptide-N4-(N-acetyl-beta-glucosaminyl)asparagine amidase
VQAEEDAAAAAQSAASFAALQFRSQSRPSAAAVQQEQASFISQVQGAIQKVRSYEDELAQAIALSVMDLESMKTKAAEAASLSLLLEEHPPLAEEDQLALELLSWFKLDFFSWVDKPSCNYCQNPGTRAVQTGPPTAEESAHHASRTETYYCHSCGTITRFPRYNDPVKLLETRKGRCGEWANAFCLICRAAGLDARLVLDFTDHIWVEYYSTALKRWIHMDPCEAAVDKPLLYEVGWGKKLTYLIAVGRDGVLDVSRRYTRQYNELVDSRRILDDEWISGYLQKISNKMRSENGSDEKERKSLEERDDADVAEMLAASEVPLSKEEFESLPGRQTGSADWVSSRGEGGGRNDATTTINTNTSNTAAASSNPQQQPSTRYQWARDTPAILLEPTKEDSAIFNINSNSNNSNTVHSKICGGVVRASGENSPGETAVKTFDGKFNTKWLDFGGVKDNSAWLEYRLLPTDDLTVLKRYSLTSGDDAPERDPEHVVVEAWVEEGEEKIDDSKGKSRGGKWVVLDERPGLRFSTRGQRMEFHVAEHVPSRRWRLRIVRILRPQQANSVQLACWDLYKA